MYQLKVLVKKNAENNTLINAEVPIPSIKFAKTKWAHSVIDALDTRGILVDSVRETLKIALANIDDALVNETGRAVLLDLNENGLQIYIAIISDSEKHIERK